ncbi:unnamed protein product [Symbiodinium natans]|uniref:Uncharacterized protein n=1 Tax=Symbiodinium natans TaxID=878477 RepID=A0A812HJS6_9DINO|nr:unnamed protein product [Symbiodinium natans]
MALFHYGGCFPFVQQLIAEDMLVLMKDLLSSTEISPQNFNDVLQCTRHLQTVLRSLTKLQRQQWVSLLVRILHHQASTNCQQVIVGDLQILWRTDGDPSRTFAEAEKQLRVLSNTASSLAVRSDLNELLWRC